MIHSHFSGYVAIYGVRGFSPLNVRANRSVIVTPSRALAGGRCRGLHRLTVHVVHRVNVINRYGMRCTFSPRSRSCQIVRMGTHLSHSSTLTSGTANCPLTFITTGLKLNCKLFSLGGSMAGAASTFFRPTLSCIIYGVPH